MAGILVPIVQLCPWLNQKKSRRLHRWKKLQAEGVANVTQCRTKVQANLWFSWCLKPCNSEHSVIQENSRSFPPKHRIPPHASRKHLQPYRVFWVNHSDHVFKPSFGKKRRKTLNTKWAREGLNIWSAYPSRSTETNKQDLNIWSANIWLQKKGGKS